MKTQYLFFCRQWSTAVIRILYTGILIMTGTACAGDADLILYDGKVITVDSADHITQAIAVGNGQIIASGTDQEILMLAKPSCRMIDLKGKTVTPGLVDSHYHLMYYGAQFWRTNHIPRAVMRSILMHRACRQASMCIKSGWEIFPMYGKWRFLNRSVDSISNVRDITGNTRHLTVIRLILR